MKHIFLCSIMLLSTATTVARIHLMQQLARQAQRHATWRQKAFNQTAAAWQQIDKAVPQTSTSMQSLQEDHHVAQIFHMQHRIKTSPGYPLPEHILLFFIHQARQKICPTLVVTPLFATVPFIQSQASPQKVLLHLNEKILNTAQPLDKKFFGTSSNDKPSASLEQLVKVHLEYELQQAAQQSQFIEFIASNFLQCNENDMQNLSSAHIVQAAINILTKSTPEEQLQAWHVLSSSPFMPEQVKQTLATNKLWQDVFDEIS